MNSIAVIILSLLYLVLLAAIIVNERGVINKCGADSFTVILIFLVIYIILPSFVMHMLLGIYGSQLTTSNYFFDKVFSNLGLVDAATVYLLTLLFVLGLYASARLESKRLVGALKNKNLVMRGRTSFLVISILLFICAKFFSGLGTNFLEMYANLVIFRNLGDAVERTFFTANAFALTQTLCWLSAAISYKYFAEGQNKKACFYLAAMLISAFLMASRRGLIFPVLILYLSSVLYKNNFHFRKIFFLMPVVIIWVAFGKEVTGGLANNVDAEIVLDGYQSTQSMILRATADIGISQVESWATFQFLEIFPRFGLDHLLSILRRVPEGMIGLDIDWPERIVRISTEAFATPNDADIPPGLIGQSWLDFPILGSFFWGIMIGIQSRILNIWASRVAHSPTKIVFIVLLSLVIAMPLNTGSYDFIFSIDIIFLVVIVMIMFKVGENYEKIESGS